MTKVKKSNEASKNAGAGMSCSRYCGPAQLTPCQGQHQLHAQCRSFSMKQRQKPLKCMPKRTLPLHPRQPGSHADAHWSIIYNWLQRQRIVSNVLGLLLHTLGVYCLDCESNNKVLDAPTPRGHRNVSRRIVSCRNLPTLPAACPLCSRRSKSMHRSGGIACASLKRHRSYTSRVCTMHRPTVRLDVRFDEGPFWSGAFLAVTMCTLLGLPAPRAHSAYKGVGSGWKDGRLKKHAQSWSGPWSRKTCGNAASRVVEETG